MTHRLTHRQGIELRALAAELQAGEANDIVSCRMPWFLFQNKRLVFAAKDKKDVTGVKVRRFSRSPLLALIPFLALMPEEQGVTLRREGIHFRRGTKSSWRTDADARWMDE